MNRYFIHVTQPETFLVRKEGMKTARRFVRIKPRSTENGQWKVYETTRVDEHLWLPTKQQHVPQFVRRHQ